MAEVSHILNGIIFSFYMLLNINHLTLMKSLHGINYFIYYIMFYNIFYILSIFEFIYYVYLCTNVCS